MIDEYEKAAIRKTIWRDLQMALPLVVLSMISVGRRDYTEALRLLSKALQLLRSTVNSLALLDLLKEPPKP